MAALLSLTRISLLDIPRSSLEPMLATFSPVLVLLPVSYLIMSQGGRREQCQHSRKALSAAQQHLLKLQAATRSRLSMCSALM